MEMLRITSKFALLVFICMLSIYGNFYMIIHSISSTTIQLDENETKDDIVPNHVYSISDILELKEKTLDYPEMDVVYTWVNGSDPVWLAQKQKSHIDFVSKLTGKKVSTEKDGTANGDNRFRDHNEMKYSIRSILKYAPWVRYIHIVVSDGQTPSWLNTTHPKIRIVPHSVIFATKAHYLPTFNSRALETQLDNIPDLSEYFLYFNDDFFLASPVDPSDFFRDSLDGTPKVYFDFYTAIHQCATGCNKTMLGDGHCDAVCNKSVCNWDMGDCGLEARVQGLKYLREHPRKAVPGRGYFIQAIKTANSVYTREFGSSPYAGERRPIAHVPYLISKSIVRDMKARFHDEFEQTSSHMFRHQEDMQYSFSYVYYVVHTHVYAPSTEQIWKAALNTANSSYFLFADGEKEVYQKAHEAFISQTESYHTLQHCAREIQARTAASEAFLLSCHTAVQTLKNHHRLRLPMRELEQMSLEKVAFYCFKDTWAKSVSVLKALPKKNKKFICLEDDMSKPIPEFEVALTTFFQTMYPNTSTVEIPF